MKTLLFLSLCSVSFAGDFLVTFPANKENATTTTVNLMSNSPVTITLPKAYKYNLTGISVKLAATNSDSHQWEDGKFYTIPQDSKLKWTGYAFKHGNEIVVPAVAENKKGSLKVSVNGGVWISVENILSSNSPVVDTGNLTFSTDAPNVVKGDCAVTILVSGDYAGLSGSLTINGISQDKPVTVGTLTSVGAAFSGEVPTIHWSIDRDGQESSAAQKTFQTPPAATIPTYTDGIPLNGHQNKGHGNNLDGIDMDNPGKGKGGPTGLKNSGLDTTNPDGTDDEILKKLKG